MSSLKKKGGILSIFKNISFGNINILFSYAINFSQYRFTSTISSIIAAIF